MTNRVCISGDSQRDTDERWSERGDGCERRTGERRGLVTARVERWKRIACHEGRSTGGEGGSSLSPARIDFARQTAACWVL